ncbi:golgin subfamily A member 6-like protein 26 [Montipora capricornis]|uniref:golgin subfamily A member 6-like protein 26 n=1 Tax=Montipora capricornis TaxID=246305 RepID=UPI0035F16DEF
MDTAHGGVADFLTKHRLLITQQLHMDRRFLFDYLISKSCFDKTDFELIQAEKTSESKAGRFLDILGTKGKSAFYHFIDALQILNPNLYEVLTGESATKRSNPIFSDIQRHITSGGGSIYLDVDILSSFSKRLSEDLQELTLWYDQKIKENNELRTRLEETLSEKTSLQRRIVSLEKHVSDTEEALASEAHSSACKVSDSLLQRFEIVQREGRTNQFIIQLQMKLLTAHEENEALRKRMEEVKTSNTDLIKQLSKVNVDYAVKKQETTKLSQQLKVQTAEMKSCEGMKMKLREVQFQKAKLQCELQEKEEKILELNQVKHWTEALKARYDLVLKEKEQALKNQEVVERKCDSQTEEIFTLNMKLNQKERDLEDVQRSYKDVEDSSRIYREERDLYSKSLRDTTLELEQMRKESDKTVQRYKKALESKESTIGQQAEHMLQIEKKYEETKKEISTIKVKLTEQREKNEDFREKISILEAQLQEKESALKSHLIEEDSRKDPQGSTSIKDADETELRDYEGELGMTFQRDRKPKEVVGSIIRRFKDSTDQQKTIDKQARGNMFSKSKSMEMLAQIIPEFETLPLETQKGCSLDKKVMKQNLPYELLSAMFPPSPSFPNDLSDALGQSRVNSIAIRQLGIRKMSAPVVTDLLSLQQDPDTAANLQDDEGNGANDGNFPDNDVFHFQGKQDTQQNFRARSQQLLRRNGERRQRRKTEPTLFTSDFAGMEHFVTEPS